MNIPWLWIKNSDGKPDAMLSFSLVAFITVIFKVFFGGTTWILGKQTVTITSIDPGMITALLGPTLFSYIARRWTDAKFVDANNNGIDDRDEATTKKEGQNG